MTRFLDNFRRKPAGKVPDKKQCAAISILPPARQEWNVEDLTLDGIVLLDPALAIVDANPRALRFLQSTLSAITGYCLWDVVPQEIASQHEAAAEVALGASEQYVFVAHESFENSWTEYTLRQCPAGYIVNLRETGPAQNTNACWKTASATTS